MAEPTHPATDRPASTPPPATTRELFSDSLLAPHGDRRRKRASLAVSLGAQLSLLFVLVGILSVHPQIVHAVLEKEPLYFPPKPPAPAVRPRPPRPQPRLQPQPPPPPKVVVMHVLPPPPVVKPKPLPVHVIHVAAAPVVALSQPAPKLAPVPLPAPPAIKLNNLPVQAAVTTARPAEQVQTGGFGDPQGAPGTQHSAAANMPKLGSFGMPEGPGNGNGTGGAHGVRGVVAGSFASAGSGDGTQPGRPEGQTRLGGFSDAAAVPTSTPAREAEVVTTPVTILFKPDPLYTPEARQLHIQGEVLLQVIFEPSGQLTILGIERGLGHGLDEQAVAAARRIRFTPATRNGKPVQTPAVLHITFQIAD